MNPECQPLADQATMVMTSRQFPGETFQRVGCAGDNNSCLLHAILRGFDPSYLSMARAGTYAQRMQYVRQIRTMLADRLTPEVYATLPAAQFAAVDPLGQQEFSLQRIQQDLRGTEFLGEGLMIFLSNQFRLDIYIMTCRPDLQLYPVAGDPQLLYLHRQSVILFFNGSHYELMEVLRGNTFMPVLPPDDPLIVKMYTMSR